MNDRNKLKCPLCGSILHLSVAYDGCDWDTVDGDGSGYGYPISLECQKNGCGAVYTLGRLDRSFAFSESIEEQRPYEGHMND